jgi:WD40 repeat protein
VSGAAQTEAPRGLSGPYVGLTYYTEDDTDLFFGRDAETGVIISNLRASRLTLLYAESGVGKSSLLRAGVAARLRRQAAHDAATRGAPRFVPVVFSSWSGDPVLGLTAAVEEALHGLLPQDGRPRLPRDDVERAVEAAAAAAADSTLLVILDQFEEYFLYRSRHEREDAFADELAACVQRADLRARFLISIREDAYAGLGDLFRGRLPNVYANFLHLDYLDRDGAREAILKPVERHNEEHGTSVAVEPALVDAVLDQVQRNRFVVSENGRPDGDGDGDGARAGSQAIETTYLQLVLKRLWDEEAAKGSDVLRLATLERLGGAETITETHLAGSMAKLPPDQQSAAASAFRYLVTARGTKIALTVRELSEMAELPESRLEPVLRRLAAGDLHILRPVALPDPGDEASYEIFHDALARPIRRWRQEREDAERAELRAQKEEAERHALEAQRREERERRRRRLALRGLAVAVAGCLGLAVALVVVFRADANHQRRVDKSIESAERIADLADSPRFGPAAAALASVEASRGLAPTFQARSQTLAALQLDVGLPRIGVGHTRPVLSVAFLPGTSLLVSGSSDGSVRLWDGRADQVGAPLLTSSDAVVSAVAVSAGAGSRIVAAARGDDETIDLWDVTRPRKPRHLRTLHVSAYVNTVAFSPDGRLLASGDDDGRITLWTLAGTSARKLRGGAGALGAVYGLAFGADGRYLASASDPGGTEVWRVDDLTARGARPKPVVLTEDDSRSIAWSADGKLAVGVDERSDEPGIRLWTVRGRRPVAGRTRFLSTSDVVYGLAFARGGSALVSGGANWAVTTWDVRTGRAFGPPRMQDARDVNGVAVSPDGDTIASAGDDQLVRIWPLEPHRTLATIVGGRGFDDLAGGRSFHLPDVWDLALGPRGVVAVAAEAGGVFFFRGCGSTRFP